MPKKGKKLVSFDCHKVLDGWSITGLRTGTVRVSPAEMPLLIEWSEEGRLFPFQIGDKYFYCPKSNSYLFEIIEIPDHKRVNG